MAYRFLPKYRSGIRPGVYLVDLIEDKSFVEDTEPNDVKVSHDGNGNVTVVSTGWAVSENGNGDVYITGDKISITDDEIGGIEMKTLTINGIKFDIVGHADSGDVKNGQVTLLASKWSGKDNYYSQIVTIEGVTENSKVDLTPTAEQLKIFREKDLLFVSENEGGVVTVYVIGQKPNNDYTIPVTITEVEYA